MWADYSQAELQRGGIRSASGGRFALPVDSTKAGGAGVLAQPYQMLVFSLLRWLDQPRLSRNETPGPTYHLHVLSLLGLSVWCSLVLCTSPVSAQAEPGRSGSLFLGTTFPRARWHGSPVCTFASTCWSHCGCRTESGQDFVLLCPLRCFKTFSKTLRVLLAHAGGGKALVSSERSLHVW